MAQAKRKGYVAWILAGLLILLVAAALLLLGLPSQRSSPTSAPPRLVVKALPPPPPSVEPFMRAEEEALKILTEAKEEAPVQSAAAPPSEVQVSKPPSPPASQPGSQLTPPSSAADRTKPPSGSTSETEPPQSPPSGPRKGPETREKDTAFSYTIHLESFKNPKTAQKRVHALKSLGLEAFSHRVDLPQKGVFHRVFVGRFANRRQAQEFQALLQKNYSLPRGRIVPASSIDR
jgi:cell division septation protein DedD